MSFDPSTLRPGDCLLYKASGFFGWLISVKTWANVSHVEVYMGEGVSVASRDGLGVNKYALRTDGIAYVLRPSKALDMRAGLQWFDSVRGQKYDWLGLLCFTLAVRHGAQDRMFCSEFATRFYRQCGFKPFASWEDADHIAPAQFLQTPMFDMIWED